MLSSNEHTDKLCIVYFVPNWFGDGIMAWPAVFKHVQDTPDKKHVLVMKPGLRSLWEYLAARAGVEILTYENSFGSMKDLVKKLRVMPLSEVFLLTETPRSHLIAFFSKAPRTRGRTRGLTSKLLTDELPEIKETSDRHRAENYFAVLNSSESYDQHKWAPVDRDAALPQEVSDLFQHADTVALFPGAARGKSKRWPYFARLAESLHNQGIIPVVLGSPADTEAASELRYGVNLCGKLSIPELAAVVAKCKAAVSNDSGGMHLVDATGTPLVAIFGLTNPAVTGPRRSTSIVLKAEGRSAVAIKKSDEQAEKALSTISVETVMKALDSLINRES